MKYYAFVGSPMEHVQDRIVNNGNRTLENFFIHEKHSRVILTKLEHKSYQIEHNEVYQQQSAIRHRTMWSSNSKSTIQRKPNEHKNFSLVFISVSKHRSHLKQLLFFSSINTSSM